jgi:predicted nucleotidyltransferase component of viral defense system
MLELKQIESFYPETLRPFKKNLLREYLQYKMLGIIFSSDLSRDMVFMGGTAIHIIHGLPRFSEDLDFDNKGIDKDDFKALTGLIQKRLKSEGYIVETNNSFAGAFRAFIRIADILYENRLSGHKEEKMLIQLDAEGQKFSYRPESIILNKFDVFTRIDVVPPDILLSQKIAAILMRKRPLGRDFYDAIFLFGKTRPNLEYLEAKLKISSLSELKKRLAAKCEGVNFKHLAKDIEQFLFSPSDAKKVILFVDFIKDLK